ncbi:hypothetical protein C8A03DRAFT_18076 [Achaetomium macrosporum]|uniref:Rhodopsin domain-containing protein n=1 Tax=Achaetomium macrosporum TaxID=79813 RepID=A0AAN7C554_9PEZI|nr:hypothetical protein C8A03DRAFT_18076 [Achaetomium macrosporum]
MATRNVTKGSTGPLNRLPPTTEFGPHINFTIWLLTALSFAFLALRVYCKFARHRGLWWDDHLLIASWLALAADCAFISACVNLGFGRPLSQFDSKQNLGTFLLLSNLAGSFSILAALWSKTSFAVTVLRISPGWIKVVVWFIIITVNAALGVAIAITWAQCTPIEKVWHPRLEGSCWPKSIQIRYNVFAAIYSGVMDIVLAVVPWKIIWTLTMKRKEKVGVMVAMSMGIFAGVTSLIKITQLPSISKSTFTESTTQLVILGAAESAITIIAASIPILRALIHDSRSPPGPAQLYHDLDFSSSPYYEGANNANNSRTVITSSGGSGRYYHDRHRGRRHSRSSSSAWNKETEIMGHLSRLSWLSRLSSGSSIFTAAMGIGSAAGGDERSVGEIPHRGDGDRWWSLTAPSPGKIVTTEEVVVEYEETRETRRGYPVSQGQGAGVGRAG